MARPCPKMVVASMADGERSLKTRRRASGWLVKLASTEDENRNGESEKRKKKENERKQKTQKGGSHCEDHFCCWLPLSEVFTDSLTETSTDKWQQQQQPQKVRPVAQVWTCNSSSNHSGKTGASGNVALSAEESEMG